MGAGSRRAEPPHFFKVILQSTIENKMLRIPEKFVRRFGDELFSVATLVVPEGGAWEVGLKKDGRKIWFHDGWIDFVEFHSICAGHFLVFEYRENSSFHVLIFDKSACEIEYPSIWKEPKNEEQNSVHGNEMEREDSDECPSNRPSSKMNTPQLQKIQVKPSFGSALGTKRRQKCAMSLESSKLKYGYMTRNRKSKMEETAEMDESRQGKLQGNEMCNSQGSLHHKRHLLRNAENLYASSSLARKMDSKIDGTKFKTARYNGGYERKFSYEVEKHSSDDDDVKKTKLDELELLAWLEDMEIFVSGALSYLSVETKQTVIDAVRLFKPKNPSFIAIVRSKKTYSHYMYVPAKFADKYLRSDTTAKFIKIQDSDGKEWPVRLRWSQWCGLKGGWRAFRKGMNLGGGDVCVFELIMKKVIVLKFSVLRASAE